MSVDPDLRIALGFILLLRAAVARGYASPKSNIGIFCELHRLPPPSRTYRNIVWSLLILPLLPFLLAGDAPLWSRYSIDLLGDSFRCAMLVPAVAGLILGIWSSHAAVHPAEGSSSTPAPVLFLTGPFRAVRFPHWSADLLLFGSLLVATGNGLAVGAMVAAVVVLRIRYLPRAEQAWQRFLGDAYADYAAHTGWLLPPLRRRSSVKANFYSVPRRFGIAEILAVTTMFALLFAGVNGLQSLAREPQFAPALNLYLGLQLLTICIGQMVCAGSPRAISAVVGAIALPLFFVLVESPPRWTGTGVVFALTLLMVVGAFVGYTLGVFAAGLFLLLDWVRPYLPWRRGRSTPGE